MDLSLFRRELDSIDTQLVKLFCRRMEISADIAAYKKETGLPVHDPVREAEKLSSVMDMAGDEFAPYTETLYALLFSLSKEYQHTCMKQK